MLNNFDLMEKKCYQIGKILCKSGMLTIQNTKIMYTCII